MRRLLPCCFFSLLLSSTALADEQGFVTTQEGNRAWFDMTTWPRPDSNIFAMGVNGQYEVKPHIMLDLEIPFAAGRIFGEPTDHAAFGNIVVGAHWAFNFDQYFTMWAGLTLAIPTNYGIGATNDALGSASIASLAAFANNSLDWDKYLPEFLFLTGRAGFEVRVINPFRFRIELSAALAIPVGSDVESSNQPLGWFDLLQAWSEFEMALPSSFVIGIRGTLCVIIDDVVQAYGGGLYVAYQPESSGVEVRLDGLISSPPLLPITGYQLLSVTGTASARIGYRF